MKNFFLAILGLAVSVLVLWRIFVMVSGSCPAGGCLPLTQSGSVLSSAGSASSVSSAEGGNIRVTSPAPDAIVTPGTLIIRGTAHVFEGQFRYRILDEDRTVIAEGTGAVTGDAGLFSPFEIRPTFFHAPSGKTGSVEVFDESAKDGSVIDRVSVPVVFGTQATLPANND